MTILRKGLLLIAIPLICQLGFVLLLSYAFAEAAEAEKWTLHTKEVVRAAESLYTNLLRIQSESRGHLVVAHETHAKNIEIAEKSVGETLARLSAMTADNPPQVARVTTLVGQSQDLIAWRKQLMHLVDAGDREGAVEQVRNLSGQTRLDRVRATLDEFLRVESSLEQQRLANLATSRASAQWAMAAGVAASAIVAVFAAWVYSRSVSGRIAVVTANAERLAGGGQLEGRVSGRDEIARLDTVIHDTARRLREAESLQARLRNEVERRASELAHTNDSLRQQTQENEMFVYSVSHDLRSPLVNLQGFSRELGHACHQIETILSDPRVPEDVRQQMTDVLRLDVADSLKFIQSAVMRSGAIIDSLLRLSRAGRVEYRWGQVEIMPIVERVIDAMRGTIQDRRAELVVNELPPAWGDATAIEQIFGNLIGNAVNYLAADRAGRVEVGVVPEQPGAAPVVPNEAPIEVRGRQLRTYYVRDNGLGIPSAYLHKVFVAFQRLHGDVAKGEGIGLALVRRIVERHSGRVWVESESGVGSTFYIALPQVESSTGAAGSLAADTRPAAEAAVAPDTQTPVAASSVNEAVISGVASQSLG